MELPLWVAKLAWTSELNFILGDETLKSGGS
jgi:hypothetical protein